MKRFEETNERFLLVDCLEGDQRIIIFASDLKILFLFNLHYSTFIKCMFRAQKKWFETSKILVRFENFLIAIKKLEPKK